MIVVPDSLDRDPELLKVVRRLERVGQVIDGAAEDETEPAFAKLGRELEAGPIQVHRRT